MHIACGRCFRRCTSPPRYQSYIKGDQTAMKISSS